jgi:HK97 gp10 family phage protein
MPAGGRVEWDEGALRDLFESADGAVARDINARAERVVQTAKRLAPVSPHGSHGRPSGYLRSSIGQETGHDGDGLYVDIVAEADYAIYQELGTSKMAAQPFLRPALDDL